jgi:hypothetical protein
MATTGLALALKGTMRLLLIASIGVLLATGTGCNSGDLTGIGGPAADDDDGPGSHGTVDPNDPHNGNQDEAIPPVAPTEFDTDGDGIPNEDDYIPCRAFYIKIWNQQVSSAEVNLNQAVIVDSSFFPTEEVVIEFINPVPGINIIDFGGRLEGSPEDELHTEIWDLTPVIYLHETMVRGNGQPEEVVLSFDVNVTC